MFVGKAEGKECNNLTGKKKDPKEEIKSETFSDKIGKNTIIIYPNLYLTFKKRSNTTDTLEKTKNTMTRIELDILKKRIFPYVQVSTQTNKLTGQKITVTFSYENYGNPTSMVKTFINGPTETITNLYDNTESASQWLLGRATSTTLQYTGGGNTITRSGSRTFGISNNNLNSETWHSGTNQQVVKGFEYNINGTLKRDSITANGSWRTTIYTYETNNIRIKTIKDPLSHITTFNYDSYGRLGTVTHPSGIIETFNYNGNGYLSSISAGGSTWWTTTSMNARGQVTAGQYGSDPGVTYGFDAYGYPTSTVTGTLQSYSYNFNTVTANLNWRQNNKYTGLKETFNYDNSDRLDNVYQGTGTPVLTLDMAYDSNKGGITTKSEDGCSAKRQYDTYPVVFGQQLCKRDCRRCHKAIHVYRG